MRDRLKEFLKNAKNECLLCWGGGCRACVHKEKEDCTLENLADHLIANGVIVLQCRVGDSVYQIDTERVYELEIFEVRLHNYQPYYETESIDFDNRAIGKSIFLTKEEAEQALKERENNA